MKGKGFIALLITALLYGSFGLYIRYLDTALTTFQQIIYLNTLVIIFLVIASRFLRFSLPLIGVSMKYIGIYALLFGIAGTCFTFAALNTKIANAYFALYIGSFTMSFLMGIFFFHEKVTVKKIGSLLCALVGLVFFTYPLSIDSLSLGLILGILAGILDACANSASKHFADKVPVQTLIMARMTGALILGIPLLLIFHQSLFVQMNIVTIIFLTLFAISVLLASYFVVRGFQNFDLNLGTIILSSEMAFAGLLGALFFGEYPTTTELIGAVFIFGAILIAHMRVPQRVAIARKSKARASR